jgi:hypothetical protein
MDLSNIPIAARFNVSINTFQLPSFSTGVVFRVVHILKSIQDFWFWRSYLGNTKHEANLFYFFYLGIQKNSIENDSDTLSVFARAHENTSHWKIN